MNATIRANGKIIRYLQRDQTLFALRGGRRAGKTFNTCIWLLGLIARGDVVIFASMTAEQGRKGAYEDCKQIISMWGVGGLLEVLKSPREIRCKTNGGVGYFSSYADPETAKGGACDWVFINEGNKFTYQQYLDLAANARKGVIVDYNPNEHFWIEEEIKTKGVEELVVTWRDNIRHLTAAQLEWFDNLKRRAASPDATTADIYYYRVYYLGEYGELGGEIFSRANLHFCSPDAVPRDLFKVSIFCDPSALRGADWFACCVSATSRADKRVYILDTFAVNSGTREDVVRHLLEWCKVYDIKTIYVETNGIIGIDFFEFARNSNLPVKGWTSRKNKFERIVANFQNLTTNMVIVEHPHTADYMSQVYEFGENCEHDDNVDALNSSYSLQAFTARV